MNSVCLWAAWRLWRWAKLALYYRIEALKIWLRWWQIVLLLPRGIDRIATDRGFSL